MKLIRIPLQKANGDKEIQQLNTDKARLMHEVQRLMQTVGHLENTMTDSEDGHTSEVKRAGCDKHLIFSSCKIICNHQRHYFGKIWEREGGALAVAVEAQ